MCCYSYLTGGDGEVDIDLRIERLIREKMWMKVLALLHVCRHVKVHPEGSTLL